MDFARLRAVLAGARFARLRLAARGLRPFLAGARFARLRLAARGLRPLAPALLGLALLAGCGQPPDPRPSILLVVIDTLRADAVSAYGEVEGTTPHMDALAREGLHYARAFAPSPWTLPSHATLLTGLPVERHGVGVDGAMVLDRALPTLAQRLGQAGYRTAGFSENPLVGPHFGLERGFESFHGVSVEETVAAQRAGGRARPRLARHMRNWLRSRDDARPDFVFVNLFDPHDPYRLRRETRFLPEGVGADAARAAGLGAGLCDRLPDRRRLEILRGLYLGEVAAADAKLGRLRSLLAEASAQRPLVTVVTSDHGEHLGEHRLLGHEFSVRNVALHVPLVVHGLPGAEPARIDSPVELRDVADSILSWAGLEAGRGLPTRPEPAGERSLFAVYSDHPLSSPESLQGAGVADAARSAKRSACRPEDRVFGDTLAVLRHPFKLIWFEKHPPQLYDLRWDARELSDLAARRPELVAELGAELSAYRQALGDGPGAAEPAPEAVEALRALGYAQ